MCSDVFCVSVRNVVCPVCVLTSLSCNLPQDLLVKGEQEVQDLLVAPVTLVVLADLEFQDPWVRLDRLDIATRIPA